MKDNNVRAPLLGPQGSMHLNQDSSRSGSGCDDDDCDRGTGVLFRLRQIEANLNKRFGVESEAIERKLPEDRRKVKWHEELSMALLWASATMNTSCFATGFLGWELGLSLKQTIIISILASIVGGALPGFAATFGAAHGSTPDLRFPVQIGWSAVACITGGLALTAVADGHLSLIVGIVILAIVAMLISFVGLRAILIYERYAWVIFFAIFLIFFGETGRYADNTTPSQVKGANLAGSILSLIAIVYGSSASWVSIAADYYVHYPADVSRVKVFLMTTFGIAIPTSIGMVAGCVVASALNNMPGWANIYETEGIGFLVQSVLYPRGFAKVILTLLVLSGINVNVVSIYSSAIAFQQLAHPFAQVPRFIWTLFSFLLILALALGGREQLNAFLQNFLSLLGYWSTSYFVVLFAEHYVFRKGRFENYDLEAWDDPTRLPVGLAALAAFLVGVVGWVLGMVETWYAGPVGKLIGTNGGDLGNELTFIATLVTYIPARYLELKVFRK
ncbi:hypothetical protein NPX13_g486 [Xylaria arbuscula]|uniref:Uncharacterized protein n=1 Tax=Xylaria arbuscula TaxID=114810 RepID=A0A9W8NP56_9PEZI|nr:hypothetical protein NPX13_g486 [Xylaria arbuscula]